MKSVRLWLLISLCLAIVHAASSDSISSRGLLQNGQESVTVDRSSAGRFATVVSEAPREATIELDVEQVELSSLLTLSRPGVKLIGVRSQRTVIRCSEEGRMVVEVGDVDVAHVSFENCFGGAVQLSHPEAVFNPFDLNAVYDFSTQRTNFTDVRFVDNEADPDSRQSTGGALTIGPGTVAVVENCVFRRNRATTGGAILIDGAGGLEMKDCVLEENEASIAGGAIAAGITENFFDTTVSISIKKSTFRFNRDTSGGEDVTGLSLGNGAPLENAVFLKFPSPAPSGGAIFLQGYSEVEIDRCTFDSNSAAPSGGALHISDNNRVTILMTTFTNNTVTTDDDAERNPDLELGGAIYIALTNILSQITVDRCTFQNNAAAYGGAIHAVTDLANQLTIVNSQFEDNEATLAGGALLLRNVIQAELRNLRFFRNRATAGGGVMFTNGAGAVFSNGPDALSEAGSNTVAFDVYFTENEAMDGGGIFLLGAGQVVLQHVRFNRNLAARNGGGVCVISSLPSGRTALQSSFFHSNAAERGGAVYADGVSILDINSDDTLISEFIKNKALAGGALHIRPSSQVTNTIRIDAGKFKQNEAVTSTNEAGIDKVILPKVRIERTALGRRLFYERNLMQTRRQVNKVRKELLNPVAVDACNAGGGGALCLLAAILPDRSSIEISLTNLDFIENKAEVGGAIYAATTTEEDEWIAQCASKGTAVEALTSEPCRSLSLASVHFRGNKAQSAGGGIFVSHPEPVYIDRKGNDDFSTLADLPINANIYEDNTVSRNGYGPNIATNAAVLQIKKPIVKETALLIVGHNSGETLPEIALHILDSFDQKVSAGIQDAAMTVSINSSIVSGQRVASAQEGVVTFTRAVALGDPAEYPINFVSSSGTTETVRQRFSIRQCIVGESRIADKKICDVCNQEYFGFNYNYTCDGCPDNARCAGAASIVPVKGYWHSTPFSPIMHECILEEACSYEGRRKELAEYHKDTESLVLNNKTVPEDEYRQCSEAYVGVLCGSCAKGYGHVVDGECVKCRHVWITAVLICVVCVWTLFLIVSTGRAAFDTIREMQDMRMVRALTMSKSSTRSRAEGSSGEGRKKTVGFQDDVVDDEEGSDQNADTSRRSAAFHRFTSTGDTNVDHIMAAEKVSETIKILTNFFQITSVGVGINASWTQSIRFLLVLEDSVASVSSGASFAPMECLMENVEDRTLIGVTLRTLFPVVLTIIYVLANVIKHRADRANLRRRLIISILVGIFFAYDTVTEMLMRIVNCITLDNPDPENPESPLIIQRYSNYAIARDEYWAEDTKHVCWKGTHGVISGVLGIPGLVLGTFGLPFGLAMLLIYYRHRGVVLNTEFLNTYGFVYQSYHPRFVFWESIIMLRKASMAAVIVYAYDLGPNLQSAIALGILIFSLLAQFLAQPFKYTSLNMLESLSLLASIFIFYSGVVFRDSHTSYGGKVVLSVIIVVTNIAMVLLFVYRLFVTYDDLIMVKLRMENVENIPDSAWQRIRLLSQINAAKIAESIQEKLKATTSRLNQSRANPVPTQSDTP